MASQEMVNALTEEDPSVFDRALRYVKGLKGVGAPLADRANEAMMTALGPHGRKAVAPVAGLANVITQGADLRDMVDFSGKTVDSVRSGDLGGAAINAIYTAAAPIGMALPGSVGGYKKSAESMADSLMGVADDVDPSMPAKLVNPEMQVFQGGPGKYGPDVPGTKPGLDSSMIGTGEGAQVYGHGHYVAGNMGVAKQYQPRDFDLEEKLAREYQGAEKIYDTDAMEVFERAMLHEQPEEIAKWLNDPENVNLANSDSARGALARYRELMADVKGGHLYEYDLPDETIAKMLDWDKPYDEQSKEVLEAIRKLWVAKGGDPSVARPWASHSGADGNAIQNAIMASYGREGATQALSEAGIPGIRYLDQGSRSAGGGTSNFVIFDDDAATLLARDDTRFDQSLLGDLPMDDASRMERARDMGFETNNPLYHGTPDSRGIYESGFSTPKERYVDKDLGGPYFFTDMSRVARSYADDSRADDMQNATPEVIKAFVKNNNPLRIDARKAPFREIQLENVRANLNKTQLQTLDEMMPDLAFREVDLDKQTISTDGLVRIAKALGNDSILIRNVRDSYTGEGSPSDVLAVFDRRSIRSVDAKFDPAKKDSADILAGLAGLGVLGAGATALPQDDSDMVSALRGM